MFDHKRKKDFWAILILMSMTTFACSIFSGLGNNDVVRATPTPTDSGGPIGVIEPTIVVNDPCKGLMGTLELQLLIGPSEAVGLEPYTFATIPFTVTVEEDDYLIEGGGPIDYYENILEAEWGSFSVIFDGEIITTGVCDPENSGQLNFELEMIGEQIVEVVVDGSTTTFPWSGTPSINVSFPIENGAEKSGEGWILVLRIN